MSQVYSAVQPDQQYGIVNGQPPLSLYSAYNPIHPSLLSEAGS